MAERSGPVDLIDRVRRTVTRYRMIAPGQTVLAACSGGPDSTALLHVLDRLAPVLGFSLAAAHFNHLTRGPASDADQQLVEDTAQSLGVVCYVGRGDVRGKVRPGMNFQAVAREMRYRFLRETAEKAGADRVALGHQADDQAETVLQNFLRGSGTAGLKGMLPCRGVFVRPLLEVRRRDILSFLASGGLAYREDASNFKTVYNRNRLRLELIPLLESTYNPRLTETLNRLAGLVREDEEYLTGQAKDAYRSVARRGDGGLLLDLPGFGQIPGALAGRVVRIAWEEFRGGGGDLSCAQVGSVLSLAAGGKTGGVVHLPGGVRVTRTYTHLSFGRAGGEAGGIVETRRLVLPGWTPLPETGQVITAAFVPSPPPWGELTPASAVLDYDRTGGDLFVRGRKPGDLFWPLGLPGRIKLKKFFIDRKVPRAVRDRVPLVATPDEIVWVGGYLPGEPYRVTGTTRRFLHLALEGRD